MFEDAGLSQRALEYALSPDLRRQDVALYIARFLSNPAVNARAWSFVKEHWTDLQPKLAAFGAPRIVEALGSFCTPDARDDVKSFFASHTLGAATRTLDQTIERMNNCIAIREKQAPILAQWLERQ
jgi:aminopeptidase N/puromycin-sensitive aminopeptidase